VAYEVIAIDVLRVLLVLSDVTPAAIAHLGPIGLLTTRCIKGLACELVVFIRRRYRFPLPF
jgi:threonine dehydrogenase-like Zn-dependent dehydrogenase